MCAPVPLSLVLCVVFFFNDTATTEIYTLSLHDALPIYGAGWSKSGRAGEGAFGVVLPGRVQRDLSASGGRPQDFCRARLEHGSGPATPQPDAQFACLSGVDRHRH